MKKTVLLLLLISFSTGIYSFDMDKYLRQNSLQSNEQFIDEFPYQSYLKDVEFTDFKQLQYDRYSIYRKRDINDNIGDRFIFKLAETFIKLYPIDDATLMAKLSIAESFIRDKSYFNSGVNEIYKITGYYLMGQVARKIENNINSKKVSLAKYEKDGVIKRLKDSDVNISIKVSSVDKAIANVKKGNFEYIYDRVVLRIKEHLFPLANYLKIDISDFLTSVVVVFILMFLFSRKTRIASIVVIALVFVLPFFVNGEKISNPMPKGYVPNPQITLSSAKKINNGVDTFILKGKNNTTIGQSIWMNRRYVQAKYIATNNVYKSYQLLRTKKNVVLASAGGFTNQRGLPLGLTIDDGKVVNAILRHDRDGLLLVQKNGGIRVLNLKRKSFHLPGLKNPIGNPLNSLMAYSDLLNWATSYRATIFQVQLLAYSNKLLIDSKKAPNQLRERRLLALFSDNGNGDVQHAVFNIESSYNLATITEEIFGIIAIRNKKIEAIVNLDVGTYNILNVFDANNRMLQHIKGPVDISTATNLLVYTEKR